jgi:hypothetical protein
VLRKICGICWQLFQEKLKKENVLAITVVFYWGHLGLKETHSLTHKLCEPYVCPEGLPTLSMVFIYSRRGGGGGQLYFLQQPTPHTHSQHTTDTSFVDPTSFLESDSYIISMAELNSKSC